MALEKKKVGNRRQRSLAIFFWEFCYLPLVRHLFFAGFYVFPWSFLFFSFGTLFSTRCSYIIPPQQLPRYWEKNGFSIDIPIPFDDSIAIGLVWNWFLYFLGFFSFFLFPLFYLNVSPLSLNAVIGLYPAFLCYLFPMSYSVRVCPWYDVCTMSHSALYLWFILWPPVDYLIFNLQGFMTLFFYSSNVWMWISPELFRGNGTNWMSSKSQLSL